jgi:hypothetical protein
VKKSKKTVFGKTYHFEEIKSVKDFQKQVKISDYEDIKPYIEKIKIEVFKDLKICSCFLPFALSQTTYI